MMEVAVITATYNRLSLLRRLLSQLDKQTLDPKTFEVIVVDDGSAEDMPARLSSQPHRYRFVPLRQQNAGPAAARHRAIENATGRVCVIIDDDMQVDPSYL